jgi:hypothetical protein
VTKRDGIQSPFNSFAPDGRLCIAAGNGIVSGTPFDHIETYLDEAIKYGMRICR